MWAAVRERRDRDGCLEAVKAHFQSHAVHFNAGTDDPEVNVRRKYHKDTRSCWGGFDAVGVMGKYDGGELEFPDLGYSFPSRPGDLFFLRGAAFRHGAVDWQGEGRMVFALFSEKNVFTKEHIPRPADLTRVYGNAYGAFRTLFPVIQRGSTTPPDNSDNDEGEDDEGGMNMAEDDKHVIYL